MEPVIHVRLDDRRSSYAPGDILRCTYDIEASARSITAIETSVLWSTQGKGDEDLGVHFFERRTAEEGTRSDLRGRHMFSTRCPESPLSYDGFLVKVRWWIRIRVFSQRGKEGLAELSFRLGVVAPPSQWTPADAAEAALAAESSGPKRPAS